MVAKEFLDSDRVNFLVWRYLLEGNYRETAAKFQKEWHVKEPHRDFPFARHVKGHALVSVINRGLLYYALEREHALRKLPQDAAEEAEAVQVGIFGPLDAHPPTKLEDDEEDEDMDAEGDEVEVSRKRVPHEERLPNGSPAAKRPRLSNGFDHGADAAPASTTTPMDVDQAHDNHAYPSPLEGEPVPPPIVRTEGPNRSTQVEKVQELAPATTFIRLVNDDHQTTTTTPSSPSAANPDNAPILLRCEWNPRDPSILAAAGTDALARVWTVSRAAASSESDQDHVSPHAHSLLDPEAPRDTTVAALAWTSDGASIAVATDSGRQTAINVWSVDGSHLQTMEVSESPVIKLSWNPSNTALLAISPEQEDATGALVTVFYSPAGNTLTYSLPDHDIRATPLDASWTSDSEFLLCGGDVFLCLHCSDSSISQVRKFETKEDDSFTQVLFDAQSRLAATSSDKGILDLWDESGQRRSISAHQGSITTMRWQPLPPGQATPDDERLIATGGVDCAILIWNARMPDSKPKCFLTMDSPIVQLAFTPDGAFIAGATATQVLIWKVDSHAIPRASWSKPAHAGWLSPKTNSESEDEDEHCLCWDADGQKLAYGSNSRLAVISFSR